MFIRPRTFGLIGPTAALVGAGGGGITTIRSVALASNNSGNTGYSYRETVVLSGGSGALGQVRVTFEAGGGGNWQIDHAAIGISTTPADLTVVDTVSAPVELKFSAASGFNLSASATLVSDWATIGAFLITDVLIVIIDMHSSNSNERYIDGRSSSDCRHNYKAASATYNVQAPAGFSDIGGSTTGFNKIETQ